MQIYYSMMYASNLLPNDEDNLLQNQLYDTLSTFLKLFRKTVTIAEHLASLADQQQSFAHLIDKIQLTFEECRPLLQKYEQAQGFKVIQPMTFNRFTCRLLQIIYLYSIKYKETELSPVYTCFVQCLKELEGTIRKHQQSRMLSDIIKVSQLSFVKFCFGCKKATKGGEAHSQGTFKKLRETVRVQRFQNRGHRFHNNDKLILGEDCDSESENQNQERDKFKVKGIAKTNTLPAYSKELLALQRRFDTIKGLDLDFSVFRADYFSAKNNHDQFFKDYLRKNEPNRRIITQYQDDFYLFQKKKNNKQNRKKKMNALYHKTKTMGHSSIQRLNSIQQTLKDGLAQDKSERMVPDPLTLQNQYVQIKSQGDVFRATEQKQQLTMSKIQIAWSKESQPAKSMMRNFKTLTKAQPICISQFYYNSMDHNRNTVTLISNKLKEESHLKHKNRPSPNKVMQNCSALTQLEHEKSSNQGRIELKSRARGKYLEVNCLRDPLRRLESREKGFIKNGNRSQNKKRLIFNII